MASLQVLLIASILTGRGSHAHPDVLRPNMDFSVKPGVDFFSYANGAWLKAHPIPAAESSYGIGRVVYDDIYVTLRKISEKAAKAPAAAGSDRQKIGDFWSVAMNEDKANSDGLDPLKGELDKIDAISTAKDAVKESFGLQRLGVETLVGFGVYQDEKQSDVMAVHVSQGGLGLPDRDFYFNKEAGVAKIRDEYAKHIQKVLELAGVSDASAMAGSIMLFETSLAQVSRKLEDLRDPISNYNKMSSAAMIAKYTPSIDWDGQFTSWNLRPKYVIVGQPEFLTGLESLLGKTPIDTVKAYMRFHLIARYSPYLGKDFEAEDFHFNHQVLAGQKTPRPRWKRVIDSENEAIGFILGRVFVQNYFPPASKKRYSDLVEAIRTAYRHRIQRLDWMSPATKKKALIKLAAVTKKVGYPDHWKDYSKLTVGRSSYCDNMMRAAKWNFDDSLSKFGKPVDRTEWGMTPQTYNAYYNPSNNEIVLPAAGFEIPGFKDSELDDAVVYGYAAASTIGHEMTHGFDDEGRQFDAKGNLKDWWTKEDAAKFTKRAQVMIQEFNSFQPLPGIHINGKASLGENIADYGGVLLGFDAFKKTKQYQEGRKIAGLTPVQRFFLGYALSWMDQSRTEALRRQLLSDVHAPAKWRVLGPLSNVPAFHEAFGIKPGQPMYRSAKDQVHIW